MDKKRENSDRDACDDSCQIGDKGHLIREELDKCQPYQSERDGDNRGKEQCGLEPLIILLRYIAFLTAKSSEVDGISMI